MSKNFKLCIVIPCYNEEKRLDLQQFSKFLKNYNDVKLCFINDGSTDKTLDVLNKLEIKHKASISVTSTPTNLGKAGAVRYAINYCNKHFNFNKIAYLDADLATSLEECYSISDYVDSSILFAYGSRIKKIDTNIERKGYRFLAGRIIATFISRQLNLPVYDTQCGCKIFDKKLSEKIFIENFISKWLFDVELFHRIIGLYGIAKTKEISREIPLKSWIDIGDSKVQFSYFFKLWIDLYQIKTYYNKLKKEHL